MITQSLDLQASYQIIQLIERSKENSELVIENLPDVFLVIDQRGKIFKCNKESCNFFRLTQEQTLGYSFSSHIEQEEWNIIQGQMIVVLEGKESSSFELPMIVNGKEKIFLWSISKFGMFGPDKFNLFSLQGRDITLLRAYQKKINDIFSSIPLGIFTVNAMGVVDDAFSEYTRFILGRSDIAGKTLKELLYDPAESVMDVSTREGFRSIFGSLNKSIKDFDILTDIFPKQFYYPLNHSISDKGKYLGLKVQSISWGDQVKGLLIILEDRTLIVEAEKADEKGRLLQDQSIERAIQIKRADPDLLEVVLGDLHKLFTELGDCVITQTSGSFKNVLHSIKSNARMAGLTNLQKLSHSFESKLRESENFSWEIVYTNMDTLLHEWREVVALYKIMTAADKKEGADLASYFSRSPWNLYKESKKDKKTKEEFETYLKKISLVNLGNLENIVMSTLSSSCAKTGKKVRVMFSWDKDFRIDMDLLSDIRICLSHLVTNSVDHGFEIPTVRVSKGKSATGLLHIGSILSKDGIILFLDDDGGGLNVERIKEQAISQGLIQEEHAKVLSDSEIVDFIFYSGFSTKTEVTELSGRGIGLSAVREICNKYNGNCKVSTTSEGLTRFELHFQLQE